MVVCTCGRERQLARCLRALAAQSWPADEVLLVDASFGGIDITLLPPVKNLRVLKAPAAKASQARNLGYKNASASVVAFTDDDAEPDTRWLENLLREFDDPAVGLVTGRVETPTDASGETLALLRFISDDGGERFSVDLSSADWFERCAFGALGNGPNMAFRKSVLGGWRGFSERLGPGTVFGGAEELYAYAEIAALGAKVVYTPAAVVIHPTQVSLEPLRKRAEGEPARAMAYICFLLAETRFRGLTLRYLAGALFGQKRDWKLPRQQRERSRFKLFRDRARGVLIYLGSLFPRH